MEAYLQAHDLPLIGAGDWNDGMNRLGIAGKGESIWEIVMTTTEMPCTPIASVFHMDVHFYTVINLKRTIIKPALRSG